MLHDRRPVPRLRFGALTSTCTILSTLCVWAVLLLYHYNSEAVASVIREHVPQPPATHVPVQLDLFKRATSESSDILKASLVVYSHIDPGWLRTVQGYWEAGHGEGQVGVKRIMKDVIQVLAAAPRGSGRKYTWGETLYLERWWEEANTTERDAIRFLVESGQLDFAGGGWVSPDEATTHATDIVDAYALGHEWLWNTLKVPPPLAGWQIDTFGHSSSHSEIASVVGARAMFFSRIDTEDRSHRTPAKQLEFLWDTVPGSTRGTDLWCYAFYNGVYDIPPSMAGLQKLPPTDPVAAELWWLEQLAGVRKYALDVAATQRGSGPIMISIARDFGWQDLGLLYSNLDELIKRANAGNQLELTYSTPTQHALARAAVDVSWPVQQGDLFPYSDCKGCYWSGYFSTRPSTKRLVREASGLLSIARQLDLLSRGLTSVGEPPAAIDELARAVALMQHHDAITGTDVTHVNEDYRRIVTAAMFSARQAIVDAFDKLMLKESEAGFMVCEGANETMCGPAVTLSDTHLSFIVVAYSALPRARAAFIEVPLGPTASSRSWTAISMTSGNRLPVQVVPVRGETRALQDYLISVHAHPAALKAHATAIFQGNIPGMGFDSWRLEPAEGELASSLLFKCDAFPANCTDDGDVLKITNGLASLTFSRRSGGLTSYEVVNGPRVTVSASLLRYSPQRNTGVLPWYLRPSGHYSFHPAGEAEQLEGQKVSALEVTTGQYVTEVTQRFSSYGTLTFKLRHAVSVVEVEWTVGPLPNAQDLILRLDTSIQTNGVFWSDSNGRQYVRRERGARSTWVPATLEPPYSNPVGRDYYPSTVGAYIEDTVQKIQLSVLTDRAQGCASLSEGSLEFMLHREAEAADELGNPETLRERLGGKPIIVRGKSIVALTRTADGPRVRREQAALTYHAPLLAFAPTAHVGMKLSAASLLVRDLPAQVDVLKFGSNSKNSVDLRVAHMFEEDEDLHLSKPVMVDISSFHGLKAARAVETLVTGVPAHAVATLERLSLRRGERIFAGPKLFNYLNFSEPGKKQAWLGRPNEVPTLVSRPMGKHRGGLDSRGWLNLLPNDLRNIRFTF